MPGGDRTGPWGQGPMTGRGAGYCGGGAWPGYASGWPGRRFARGAWGGGPGFGAGRGWRNRAWATGQLGWLPTGAGFAPAPWAPLDAGRELQGLRQLAGDLKAQLAAVEKRLQELASDNTGA